MPNKRNDDIEELIPEPGYVNPGRANYNRPHGSTYTSGTLQEALTGNYYNYRPDTLSTMANGRPIGHGKSWGNGRSATVSIGQAVPGASRGVGQPTIDGMLTGNKAMQEAYNGEIKQAVMQEFIRQLVAQSANNKLTPPRRRQNG